MKKSVKNSIKEEEVAETAVNPISGHIEDGSVDEMSDIKKFIQKRRLQNKILKKLTDELESSIPSDLNRSKSA